MPAGPPRIEEPPPPTDYWHEKVYQQARGFDAEAVKSSATALAAYREAYREDDHAPYPLRVTPNPMTGLPALFNGYLPVGELPATPGQALTDPEWLIGPATRWLLQPAVSRAAFGLEPGELFTEGAGAPPRLKWSGMFRSNLGAAAVQPAQQAGQYQQTEAVHVNLQQWHDGKWPVYGGRVTLHAGLEDIRISLSSSFMPLLPGTSFDVQVDALTAFEIAATAFKDRIEQFDAETWEVVLVPYEGSRAFILPFKGDYRLAYCLETSSPSGDDGWRVFVSAEDTESVILGPVEHVLLGANSFFVASSAGAIATPPTLGFGGDLGQLWTALSSHIDSIVDAAGAVVNLPILQGPGNPILVNRELEAANIAYYAQCTLDYFRNACGADPSRLLGYNYESVTRKGSAPNVKTETKTARQTPPLHLIVNKIVPDALKMGFNPAKGVDPKRITFQTLNEPLALDGLVIHNPSLDPEVIEHEFTHAIMWLLNPLPFDEPHATVPFTRALLEGYASYFARSLAARDGNDAANNPHQLWDYGAYRKDVWHDRWDFDRTTTIVGADVLTGANVYPAAAEAGLGTYDLGMVWARALWRVRALLAGAGPSGLDLADRVALAGFYRCTGLIASFTVAAQGVLDAALQNGVAPALVTQLQHEFAARHIM